MTTYQTIDDGAHEGKSRTRKTSKVKKWSFIILLTLAALITGFGIGFGLGWTSLENENNSTPQQENCAELPAFGLNMKNCWYPHLAEDWVFLNHGSYGAAPTLVLDGVEEYRFRSQVNADLFFREELVVLLDDTRRQLADYVGADSENLVLVDDVTEAVNAVVRSLTLPPGTRVVRTSFTYLMVQNAVDYMLESGKWEDVTLEVVEFDWPLPDEEAESILIDSLTNTTAKPVSFLLLDHISSSPMMVFDVAKIIAEAKTVQGENMLVFVDGAHALGQIPLQLNDLTAKGVHYYCANAHKWLSAERGAAFLHIAESRQAGIHPAVISNRYTSVERGWPEEFNWRGTRDYSPLPGVQSALEARAVVGDGEWRGYNDALCKEVGVFFHSRWNTTVPYPNTTFYSMVMVGPVPCTNEGRVPGEVECYDFTIGDLSTFLFDQQHISTTVFEMGNAIYFRLSCQVYNSFDDYVYLADVVDAFPDIV